MQISPKSGDILSSSSVLVVNTTKQINLTTAVQVGDLLLFVFRLNSINRRYTVPIYINSAPSNYSIITGANDEVIATCYDKTARVDLTYISASSTPFTDLYINNIYLWNK